MRILMVLLAALVLGVAPARADEAKLSAELDAFEQLTLWRDAAGTAAGGAVPTGVIVRWNRGLRVRVVGRSSSNERASTLKFLRQAGEIAGLTVTIEDGEGSGENFKIEFFPEYSAPPMLQSAGCLTRYWNTGGALTRVELYIRSGIRDFDRCVSHEMLHGFGIPAHPHNLRSVMSYTQQSLSEYTQIDIDALRTLYHPSITPGMFHLAAMVAARKVIAERLGMIPAGGDANALARPVMDQSVARLRKLAEGNDRTAAIAATQLSIAYLSGHYVGIDRAEAGRYIRLGADRGAPEAQFAAGLMMSERGNPIRDDQAAVVYLEKAAAQNHAGAMFALAGLLASGRGREADPVAAYAWYMLAAARNVPGAATARDNLSANLSAAQLAEAKSRAEKLVPQPAR
ncbi:MAG: DUF2927 domain-containing protein [Alphaproteobacteria bacterium]|nr:DUF2927 domain-containing protein [Alphaproteobacteria bacterium]